jgi:hypothetical protein
MIAVGATGVAFAVSRINPVLAMIVATFFFCTGVTGPNDFRSWSLLSIGVLAALPYAGLAWLYTFALRAAIFLGHWPSYDNPDPKNLPDRFGPQTEFLELVIPMFASIGVTWLFVSQARRFTTWYQRFEFAAWVTILLWLVAFLLLGGDPAGVRNWIAD